MKFTITSSDGRKVTTVNIEGAQLRTLQAYAELHGLSVQAALGRILEEELARAVERLKGEPLR